MQRNLIVLGVVVILLAAAVYFIYPPGSSTKLGLDLQGGLAVILQAKDTAQAPRTDEGMTQAMNIINQRINGIGVTEPEVQRQGQWKISVQLPGIADPQEALDLIGKTAVLEFYDTNQFGTPYAGEAEALKAAKVDSKDKLPKGTRLIYWPAKEGSGATDRWFLVTTEPKLTGSALSGADVGFDTNNQPKVDMQFKGDGGAKFAELTGQMAQTAQLMGQDQLLAIVLDGTVQSAPRVQDRIEGGRAEITGKFSMEQAKALALVLKTGALPLNLEVIQQRTIGATLGKASLNQALIAGLIGFILILVFMAAYYRLLGLVADVSLLVFGVLFWGLLNAIGVTLTLPGIAGAVLTLGIAADANIIIFARVREEVRAGKSMRAGIDTGFRRALHTIVDANATTLITAGALFWAATGAVRGFAVTLAVGVVLSMFTAVVVTRALLNLMADRGWLRGVSTPAPAPVVKERRGTA